MVTFTISDLLRSKCVGSLEEIKQVYHTLKSHPRLEVYRVKNRIDTSNKDFLVNVRLRGTPMLCEIQLKILQKSEDEKQGYISHFSHLLYELGRASYGPIAESVMINSHLTGFASFFKAHTPRVSSKECRLVDFKPTLKLGLRNDPHILIDGYEEAKKSTAFICTHCLAFRPAYSGFLTSLQRLPNPQKPKGQKQTRQIVCGDCACKNLEPESRDFYLLGKELARFFQLRPRRADIDSDEVEDLPDLLCAIERAAPTRKVRILQKAFGQYRLTYVPVFCSAFPDRNLIVPNVTSEELHFKYYLFDLKPRVRLVSVNSAKLAGVLKATEVQSDTSEDRLGPTFTIDLSALEPEFYKDQRIVPSE